ncbi:MAG TPA: sigma-70 family RNA polymerase sigma factor [Caulobacteraceae bacterium]
MLSRAEWFAEHILPMEPKVRAWLRKAGWRREEVEDLIQETYARVAAAYARAEVAHPQAYVFTTLRNVAADQLRRQRIVSIRSVADMSRLNIAGDELDAEQRLTAHEELEALREAIDRLPAQCRAVFVLRKVEGLSQAQTAAQLGLSQNTVEKYVARGMRLCAAWLTRPDEERAADPRNHSVRASRGNRRPD